MKPKTPPAASAPTISADDLSGLVGVTPVRLRQLSDAGNIPKANPDGRYELRPTLIALFKFYRAHRGADAEGNTYGKARLEKLQAEAELARLAADERAGQLIEVDAARRVIAEALGPVRSRLVSWPAALSSRCNPGDPELARVVLAEAVKNLLTNQE